ncbi:FAD-dependent oxidoreductase [Sphingomonas nostoxanthinifaciens]|uniref:FAD-dependent oxidoreductase n=1 Tax=Sphingomonas nostoxanthinifaciens TaxID=2872652 RepID=UPI001CC1D665|nr:FAD-dependent oxidoreductase [Sphingomonas nostoxanthinifaciens]UAK25537.1 FAD-dependent oxidoreductase [Sphingomonas nostoxanthinifaciens]
MEERTDIDVLICGAGAAGLTLAIDLARRGISFRIIDQAERPFGGSRGKGIQPRTQEVFEDLGIIDRVMAAGGVYPPMRAYEADGSFTERQGFQAPPTSPDVPYFISLMIPQFLTEDVMRERLAELGHAVEFGHALTGLKHGDDGVSADIVSPQGEQMIYARYLIGADGGHSFVRNALGIGFPGKTLGVRAIVADVRLSGLNRDAWHQFNDGDMERLVAICPLAGTNLFQVQAPIALEGDPDLSAEGLERMIAERTGRSDIELRSVSWASAYRINARLADRYGVGRVFLIGDAAHVHPPMGGQGLNTGVQDAYNLAWKLAAVLAGAPDDLLETYEEERRPVAADVLGLSTRLLAGESRQDAMRRGEDTSQLGIRYPASSLSHDNGKRTASPLAGDRMPDATLAGAAGQPRRLFELLAGVHWTLLIAAHDYRPTAAREGLRVVTVGPGAEIRDVADQLGLSNGGGLLIRPDGYVGATFDRISLDRVDAYLAKALPARGRVLQAA